MSNYTDVLLKEYYDSLDEIYAADFKTDGAADFYHFYQSIEDLIRSLSRGVIYSSKNDKQENARQYDFNAAEGEAYVCMTNSIEGKQYIANQFNRPVGLSFTKAGLDKLCRRNDYRFNSEAEYSRFGDLLSYKTPKQDQAPKPVRRDPQFGYTAFFIYSIGQLAEDLYFICGGQGNRDSIWSAKLFSSKTMPDAAKVYASLKAWFEANISSGVSHIYYHFVDGNVGQPIQTTKYKSKVCPIAVTGNKNLNYKPRENPKEPGAYLRTINFTFSGVYKNSFKEVIGYGPINVVDETGKKLLGLSYVDPNAISGYSGPLIIGKNLDTNLFADSTQYIAGFKSRHGSSKGKSHLTLAADTALAQSLYKIYDEHEYRVYMPTGRDMRFNAGDINSIVLPAQLAIAGCNVDLERLVNQIIEGTSYKELIDSSQELLVKTGVLTDPNNHAVDLIIRLYKLLTGPYEHVAVEFNKEGTHRYLNTTDIDTSFTTKANNKQRQVVTADPDLDMARRVQDAEGQQTWIAPILLPNGDTAEARLGAEVILTAKDEAGNKYILFVYKSKSENFMELPGGGFVDKPATTADFIALLKSRLAFKCNINSADITNLKDTGKALLLHEVGVAQKKLAFDWSYYKLFEAEYSKVLTDEELDYSFNNREQAAAANVRGYTAYMRWIPVDGIKYERAITARYFSILPLLEK